MPMNKNSTLNNSKFKSNQERLSTAEEKMAEKISYYLNYLENNLKPVSDQAIDNIMNFARSYRVIESATLKQVELNLN